MVVTAIVQITQNIDALIGILRQNEATFNVAILSNFLKMIVNFFYVTTLVQISS